VKGVTRAQVSLETAEALVTYDPKVATVDDLVSAVKNAKGIKEYSAEVKSP